MDEEETVKGPFTQEEKKRLREAHVCVIGCGGLGGYVTEMLVRAGVGTITVSDGDVFDESNLTRQLYSVRESMGRNKAEEAGRRAAQIDPDVRLEAVPEYLTAENAGRILSGGSVCIDALDGFETGLCWKRSAGKKECRWCMRAFLDGAAKRASSFRERIFRCSGQRTLPQPISRYRPSCRPGQQPSKCRNASRSFWAGKRH